MTVPLAAVIAFGMLQWGRSLERSAETAMQKNVLAEMLSQSAASKPTDFAFVDADGDLVADSPADVANHQNPETLIFSYIAEPLDEGTEGTEAKLAPWEELTASLSESTGKPVIAKHYQNVEKQLVALRAGEIHILGLGTGAAPLAVNSAGFTPLCTLAQADGTVGYKMVMLAAASSEIKTLANLKGRKVVFVRPTSNSGFKAALVHLYEQHGALPEQDYAWSFSLSHEDSIRAVLAGKADMAPVASDILAKLMKTGEVKPDEYRVLYESEAFPPAVLGCAHNLSPELVDALRNGMIDFDWTDTGLQAELGPTGASKFAPVNYKDDWANIRRIDTMVQSLAQRR